MGLFKLLLTSRRTAVRAYALVRDGRVPLRLKLTAIAALLFIVSPLNILGDIPLLGIADDAVLIALLLSWFVRVGSPYGAEISKQTLMATRSSIAL